MALLVLMRSAFVGLEAGYWEYVPDASRAQVTRYSAMIDDTLDDIIQALGGT